MYRSAYTFKFNPPATHVRLYAPTHTRAQTLDHTQAFRKKIGRKRGVEPCEWADEQEPQSCLALFVLAVSRGQVLIVARRVLAVWFLGGRGAESEVQEGDSMVAKWDGPPASTWTIPDYDPVPAAGRARRARGTKGKQEAETEQDIGRDTWWAGAPAGNGLKCMWVMKNGVGLAWSDIEYWKIATSCLQQGFADSSPQGVLEIPQPARDRIHG